VFPTLIDRGCSDEVAKKYTASFLKAGSSRWDPESIVRRIDPRGERPGGRALRAVLRLEISGQGVVMASTMKEPSHIEPFDKNALETFAVGVSLPPPPDCGGNNNDLQLSFGLCIKIGRPPT
jgi:hypothetical protein